MLLIALVLFGMVAGAIAQLLLGSRAPGINWPMAFASGLAGSFLGGLLVSLINGDGLELRPAGLIGSVAGAVTVTAVWQWWAGKARSGPRG